MNILKQIFCKHDYKKIGYIQEIENNVRYSVRHYMCNKCGKTIWVDGRYDRIEKINSLRNMKNLISYKDDL